MESVKCRICHRSSGVVLLNMFETLDTEKYIEDISQYLEMKVSRNDGHSPLICHLCVFDLELCSKLTKTYSSSCSGTISNLEANECSCCICSGALKTVQVDEQITKLVEKAKNCLSYKGDCPLLKETANKVVCRDCLFKLNEVCQFYSKVHRDVIEEKRCSDIVPKTEKELSDGELEREEPDMRNHSQTTIRYGPSTTRRPKKATKRQTHMTCKICKTKVKSKFICKKCKKHIKSVKVVLTDLMHSKKL